MNKHIMKEINLDIHPTKFMSLGVSNETYLFYLSSRHLAIGLSANNNSSTNFEPADKSAHTYFHKYTSTARYSHTCSR